jgi:hypothetical protein
MHHKTASRTSDMDDQLNTCTVLLEPSKSCHDLFQNWKTLACSDSNTVDIEKTVIRFVREETYKELWKFLLNKSSGMSGQAVCSEAKQIILGYHVLCNLCLGALPELNESKFLSIIFGALVSIFPSDSLNLSLLRQIISDLSENASLQFLHVLAANVNGGMNVIVGTFDTTLLLLLMKLILSVQFAIFEDQIRLIRAFMVNIIAKCNIAVFIGDILLRRPLASSEFATVIVQSLSAHDIVTVIERAVLLWSDSQFARYAKRNTRLHICHCIQVALRVVPESFIMCSTVNEMSTVALISTGVSLCLDSSDIAIRRSGMQVAVMLAKLLKADLHFAELSETENSSSAGMTKAGDVPVGGTPENLKQKREDSDSDGSDSELSSVESDERMQKDASESENVYLHRCLEGKSIHN